MPNADLGDTGAGGPRARPGHHCGMEEAMKAVRIDRYGGPEVLAIAEVPSPKPREDEVVVAVAATSVNPVDWLVRFFLARFQQKEDACDESCRRARLPARRR